MISPPLDALKTLKQFDRLRAEGELFYSPTQPTSLEDAGLQFEIRLVPSFSAKPQLAAAGGQSQIARSVRRPPPTDGSDIDHSDPAFFVCFVTNTHLHQTHKLILNKFCLFRPQYLLLTTDATCKQTSPLNDDDLLAAWEVLDQLKAPCPHYIIYNCGRDGGSSRSHKHMQLLQCPSIEDGERSLQWPDTSISKLLSEPEPKAGGSVKHLPLPYLVFFDTLEASSPSVFEDLRAAYEKQTRACASALGCAQDGGGLTKTSIVVPHNVILTREWLLTIPRRAASTTGLRGHIVNATGMMGLVWAGTEAQFDGWRNLSPVSILRTLGVPIDSERK